MRRTFALLVLVLMLTLAACGRAPAPTGPDRERYSYTVTVVSDDGQPIRGATVILCQNRQDGVCYAPVKTDADGVARFDAAKVPRQDDMKVKVGAAEGYVLPRENDGYTVIPAGVTELTLTLKKA